MLSKEEKKAIDNLFNLQHINTYLDLSKESFRIENKTIIKWKESTAIVLNLINRLQNENEYWKNRIEKGKKDVIGLKLYEMGIVCEDLQEELKEKDKQIDLMAEHIVSSAIVDDTVCAIKCDCESDILEDCSHEKMLNCTKQYFKRKATNIG